MSKRLTTEEFKIRAKEVHGDKYDYSSVNYINCSTKVRIFCKIHKDFWQLPDSHIRGRGCPKCGRSSAGITNSKEISEYYRCTKCNKLKHKSEFHKKNNKHGIRSICKDCRATERADRYSQNKKQELEYGRLYKKNNPEKRRETSNKSAAKNLAWFRDFLNFIKDIPCADCGIKYPPCAMDFDHRDPLTKCFNVSEAQSKNYDVVLAEIVKCDIVCANCHRIRGQERRITQKITKYSEFLAPFKNVPCADCNIVYPAFVMDFDHKDPSQKSFNISKPPTISDKSSILEEIKKCDIVCANCHRIRTFITIK